MLELLRGSSQALLLAYLQHLVSVQGTSREELHTELALVLGQAALDLLPASASSGEHGSASVSGRFQRKLPKAKRLQVMLIG